MIDIPDTRRRTYTVVGIALAMFLGALDQTIVSTALPRIVTQLGGLDRYTWVTTVYLLVSTLLVPLYGKLADLMNRKTLELVSVGIFLFGSMLCGLSGEWGSLPVLGDGMSQLIVFRGIQGLGGAGLFAMALIIISNLFPPRDRGKVGGLFGAIFGLSSVLGPLIGGFLTDNAGAWLPPIEGWRWVFYVNLPLGAVALIFLATRMPSLRPSAKGSRLDAVSTGLMVLGFFPLVLALQLDKSQHPWTSAEILSLLGGGVLMLFLWVMHSLKLSRNPILDLRLFRNPVFTMGVLSSFLFGAAFLSILVFLPLYMVNVQGVSATGAGASVIPLTLGIILGAGLGGPLATKLGRYKAVLVVGGLVTLAGTFLMTFFTIGTPFWFIVLAMVVTGVGFGPAQSLYAVAVQNAIPVAELGQATSFSQFTRQIGSTVGVAIAGALFSAAIAAFGPATVAGVTHPSSADNLRQGPQEVRAEISKGFDMLVEQADDLFDLRGEEARKALQAFLADSKTPSELKAKLKNGTPAIQIEDFFTRLEANLETIVVSGDRKALEALFASDEGKTLPDASRAGITAIVVLPRSERQASIERLREQMHRGMDHAIEGSSLIAKAVVKANLEAASTKVSDAAVFKIAQAFSKAIWPIWWLNVVLVVLLLTSTSLLPSLALKGRGEAGESAANPA